MKKSTVKKVVAGMGFIGGYSLFRTASKTMRKQRGHRDPIVDTGMFVLSVGYGTLCAKMMPMAVDIVEGWVYKGLLSAADYILAETYKKAKNEEQKASSTDDGIHYTVTDVAKEEKENTDGEQH